MKMYLVFTDGEMNIFSTKEKAIDYCLKWYEEFPGFCPPMKDVENQLREKMNFDDIIIIEEKIVDHGNLQSD